MDTSYIRSYLVRLGYDTDPGAKQKFDQFLGDSNHLVQMHTGNIGRSLLTWQGAIVTAFNGVAAAVIGISDKTAMGDQQMRLLGQRMMIGTNAARAMTLATDALGASIDQIAWDRELRNHFTQLLGEEKTMTASLGPDFERNMEAIRDIRFEFSRLKVELSFVQMSAVNALFKAMGTNAGEVRDKLRGLNDYIVQHIPQIGEFIASHLVPVMKDWASIMSSLKELGIDVGLVFTNLVGILSGDTSLEGTSLSFDKIADSIGHVVHWMAEFVQWITLAEKMLVHFALATELLIEKKPGEARKEFQAGLADLSPGTGAVVGTVVGGAIGAVAGAAGGVTAGPVGMVLGALGGGGTGGILGGMAGFTAGGINQGQHKTDWTQGDARFVGPDHRPQDSKHQQSVLDFAGAAMRSGVSEAIIRAFAQVESSGRQYKDDGSLVQSHDKQGNVLATGVMQLMPVTAAQYGVDAKDGQQNLDGGAKLIADLLQRYHGDLRAVAGAYNYGPANYDRAIREHRALPAETQMEIARVTSILHFPDDKADYTRAMRDHREGQTEPRGATASAIAADAGEKPSPSVQVSIGDINIMQPGASPEQIRQAVAQGARDAIQRQTRNTLGAQGGVFN